MLFVFCLQGMVLFGHIKEGEHGGLDEHNNFTNFYLASVTIWRMTTGDGWTAAMHDTIEDMGLFTCIYWILFVCINVHIVLNIVIAVIFDKLDENTKVKKKQDIVILY
jgi:hypothetical protein